MVRPEFLFLNRLRESGATNMWGAGPWLEEFCDVSPKDARRILGEWMAWVNENPANRDL